MKDMKVTAIVIILLLLSGCVKTSVTTLAFEFDSDGKYLGFENLPTEYTAEQAEKDGCYVVEMDTETVYGEQAWKDFVKNALNGKDVSIRIVKIYDDKTFFRDLFYIDGYYRIFDSSSEDLQDYKFKYLLTLEGTLPNAARSGKVTILTDDKDLTYDDIMWQFLSSTLKQISPFRLVMME